MNTISRNDSASQAVPLDQAVEYAFGLPATPVTLTAITPDGPTETKSFPKTDTGRRDAAAWIEKQQAQRRNIYFQDCSVRTVNKRPKKKDASVIHAAHVDIDVKGRLDAAGHAKAKAELRARVQANQPRPNEVNDSGNGFQAFWYLADPLEATPENIAHIEAINRALADALGGDRCHDVAHLMRLPGTVNYPNEVKRGLGRVVCVATPVYSTRGDFADYSLDELPSDPIADPADTVDSIGAIDIPDTVDLSRLDPLFQELITKGTCDGEPMMDKYGDKSRSGYSYHCACGMRRAGYTDGEIVRALTDPDFAMAEHTREQKQRDPITQASRVIKRMNDDGVESIPEGSEDFGPDPHPETETDMAECLKRTEERRARGEQQAAPETWESIKAGWCYVGQQKRFVRKRDGMMWDKEAFNSYFANVTVPDKRDSTPVGSHALTRQPGEFQKFDTFCYLPGEVEHVDGAYNLYVPSAIVPARGDTSLWDSHLAYLFPDETIQGHVLDWLAWVLQNPDRKPKHALFIRGEKQGTGKSLIGDVLAAMISEHNRAPVDQGDFETPHNGWQMRVKLVTCEEIRSLSFAAMRKLHSWITQERLKVNEKNMPQVTIPDVIAYLFFSNKIDALPVDDSDRRYLVASTEATPKDKEYYCRLYDLLDDPAALGAIKWALLNRKLGAYTAQGAAPYTDAKGEMIEASASDLQDWMVEHAGEPPLSYRLVREGEIIEVVPNYARPRTRFAKSVREVLRRRFNGVSIPRQIQPWGRGGDKIRVWAIGEDAKATAALEWSDQSAIYRAEHERAEAQAKAAEEDDFGP